jgi:hypothetical protein
MPSVALITLCIYRMKHCRLVPTSSYDGTIQGIVLVVKPAGHRLRVVTAGGRNYKLDANVEWINVGSIVASLLVIPNSWLLRHQRSNAVTVHRLLRHEMHEIYGVSATCFGTVQVRTKCHFVTPVAYGKQLNMPFLGL